MCSQAKLKNDKYNKIVICNYNTRDKIEYCDDIDQYHNLIKINPALSELIGGNQNIKPVYDIDAYENDIDLTDIKDKINTIFPNKNICFSKREPRIETHNNKKVMKYSYRAYVQGVQISYENMKYLFKASNIINDDKRFDVSIYAKKHLLFLPHTTHKMPNNDTKKPTIVPELLPQDNATIFQCSASYIEENYYDWNKIVEDIKEDIRGQKLLDCINFNTELLENALNNDKNKNNNNKNNDKDNEEDTLKIYLDRLKPTRFEPFDTWLPVMLAIINIGFTYKITKLNIRCLVNKYSSLADNYDEDKVETWFDSTYNKQNSKGYGFPYILKCVKEDDPEWYEINVGKTYENIKKEFDTRVFKCNDPIGFVEINNHQNIYNPTPYYILTKTQVNEKYLDLCYYEKNEKGKIVKSSFIKRWFIDDTKRTYHNVIFTPTHLPANIADNHFNLFKGYKAERLPVFKDYEIIQPFLDHLFIVLSNSRTEVYNFLLQWFAQIIRNPIKKTQVFIILKSEQGSGKNIIIDMIGKQIIGEDYCIDTASPERIFFGTFNSLICNKTLIVCNEAGSGMRDCIDKIKDVITAPTINIEKKGKDPIVFNNHTNGIGTTNNRAPIPIAPDDRRIVLFNCSMVKKGDTEYFNRLGALCENDVAISSFYHYLLEEVKITITNFQKDRPITEEYKKVQLLHVPNCICFMISIKNTLDWKLYNHREICLLRQHSLYLDYKRYCEGCKITPYSKKNFYFDIVCGTNGIMKATKDGCEAIRLEKTQYEEWIRKYTILECEIDEENYDGIEFSNGDNLDSD